MKKYLFGLGAMLVGAVLTFVLTHGGSLLARELQKVSSKVKRQTGSMGDTQQKLFASQKIPWLLDEI